jgi:hypothetical protein
MLANITALLKVGYEVGYLCVFNLLFSIKTEDYSPMGGMM